jgi:hypothetical protein
MVPVFIILTMIVYCFSVVDSCAILVVGKGAREAFSTI